MVECQLARPMLLLLLLHSSIENQQHLETGLFDDCGGAVAEVSGCRLANNDACEVFDKI